MGELSATRQMPKRGPRALAMVQKEREAFAKKRKAFQETGAFETTRDRHFEIANKLALVRLAVGDADVYESFAAVLSLAEVWQDEMDWERCVLVELKKAHAAASTVMQSTSAGSTKAKNEANKSG